MKYKTIQEIETRKAAILEEMKAEGADLDALQKEMEELRENAEELAKAEKKAEETRKAIATGAAGIVLGAHQAENRPQTLDEIRSSKEYVDAYAKYVKSVINGKADDSECRALLTTNATAATGYVPVPVLVDDIVRHAWENENVLSRVKKTGFTGNVKVAFELSADPAYVHSEGATAHTEEALTLGIVEIKPENIKKWISISDEMMETTGEGFLQYVYEELAYQVMKKLSYEVIGDISGCAYTTNQSTAVGIPKVKKNPGITTIAQAVANLSDEAQNIVVIMNPLTKVAFLEAYAAGNFAIDPFAGLTVLTSGKLPAFDTASENDTYAIVGDLTAEQVNFPAGEGLKLITDPYSLAERDLVKLVGRVYAGHAVTAPGRLVRLTKEASGGTTT
ncbi:MAG: phage major capsid protein [Clostridia bacterium]|nr:phage major capsid protein [Clostridia bacterium]